MALYIDSAYLEDINAVAQTIPLAGVTTNPSIVLAAHERGQTLDPRTLLEELLHILDGTIFIQPGATNEEEMYRQAQDYISAAPDRVIPKIPMTEGGMRVAHKLKQHYHPVAFTAVASVAQAYTAAMLGADFIIPYYNRLQRSGIDASERIADIAALLHNFQLPSRILVASIKSPQEATMALLAGAHDITAAPSVLLAMVHDPLTDEAMEKFRVDYQKCL